MSIVASILFPTTNISLLEIIRLLLGMVGIYDAVDVAARSHMDLRWLKVTKRNGLRKYSAETYRRLHLTFVAVQMFLLGSTILALTQPKPTNESSSLIGNTLIILTIACLMVASVETDRRKKRLYEMIDEQERKGIQ